VNVGLRLIHSPDEAWDAIEHILDLGSREKHKIAEAVRLGIAWNFAHESGGGEPWAPLAPMTTRLRRELGFAGEHPILQRTRELKRSLVEEDHPLNFYEEAETPSGISMEFGSDDPRFPLLHAGGFVQEAPNPMQMQLPGDWPMGAGRSHYVPPRPMTVLGDEAIKRLRETIEYVLHERWARLP
jgi:hypothetical protein